ncbi:unnamed protein product [Didymodactylos carnosus]|uniref:Uncharacterized protein n=1 Tax=Didymodactylos carnosus TaxID=1234261 RepID=A0A814QGC7_9BILA|nr:unnamed protein product [Didymodactylos carnosus]CAF3882392.1 unnamed protein product [Didymodactylos carnosus]
MIVLFACIRCLKIQPEMQIIQRSQDLTLWFILSGFEKTQNVLCSMCGFFCNVFIEALYKHRNEFYSHPYTLWSDSNAINRDHGVEFSNVTNSTPLTLYLSLNPLRDFGREDIKRYYDSVDMHLKEKNTPLIDFHEVYLRMTYSDANNKKEEVCPNAIIVDNEIGQHVTLENNDVSQSNDVSENNDNNNETLFNLSHLTGIIFASIKNPNIPFSFDGKISNNITDIKTRTSPIIVDNREEGIINNAVSIIRLSRKRDYKPTFELRQKHIEFLPFPLGTNCMVVNENTRKGRNIQLNLNPHDNNTFCQRHVRLYIAAEINGRLICENISSPIRDSSAYIPSLKKITLIGFLYLENFRFPQMILLPDTNELIAGQNAYICTKHQLKKANFWGTQNAHYVVEILFKKTTNRNNIPIFNNNDQQCAPAVLDDTFQNLLRFIVPSSPNHDSQRIVSVCLRLSGSNDYNPSKPIQIGKQRIYKCEHSNINRTAHQLNLQNTTTNATFASQSVLSNYEQNLLSQSSFYTQPNSQEIPINCTNDTHEVVNIINQSPVRASTTTQSKQNRSNKRRIIAKRKTTQHQHTTTDQTTTFMPINNAPWQSQPTLTIDYDASYRTCQQTALFDWNNTNRMREKDEF